MSITPSLAVRKVYAQFRIAQSYRARDEFAAARAEYASIAANTEVLPHHRVEAEAILLEMERTALGLSARDPEASRTMVPPISGFAAEVWVGPEGLASNPGTAARPFATLVQAREAVRRLKAGGLAGAVAVTVKPGVYPLTETFALGSLDSGSPSAPVVYRALRKGSAVFRGGQSISGFTPVTDAGILARLPAESRGKVLQCDLASLGISDFGALAPRGFRERTRTIPVLELYFNGQPMTLARFPNQGFITDSKIFRTGSDLLSTFEYAGDRPARWTQARDAWLFGYWRHSWADGTVAVGSIDPVTRRLTTAEPYMDAQGLDVPAYPGIEVKHGIRYFAFNLLEEIDVPGEWYLDRESGMLYFYPPSDPAGAVIELSMLDVPMVMMDRVSHVRLEGLTFDLARHDGVIIRGGDHCLLAGCTISRLAGGGAHIDGGAGHGVQGCDIFLMGRNGIGVSGGDRPTLTPAGHVVENCHIHDFSRIDRTYTPAIWVDGVGIRIAHNLIHDTPCHALRVGGNDHVIEFNEFHSVVRESDDQGAVDMFGNPTYRGVIFRYNSFHHIGGDDDKPRAGIRLDDAISGMLIYGNVFHRASQGHFGAVQVNSGRENIIENNIIADCKQAFSGGWTPGWSENNTFWKLFARNEEPAWTSYIMNDLYLARYPLLRDLREKPPVNFLWRNVLWNSGSSYMMSPAHTDTLEIMIFNGENPGFANPAAGDFRLMPDSDLVGKCGFRPIPVEEIGLYEDEFRAAWPVKSWPVAVPDWKAINT